MSLLNVLKELNTIMPPPTTKKYTDPDIKANNRLGSIIQQNKTCEFCGKKNKPLDYAHLNDATGEYFDPSSTDRSEKGSAFRHLTHVSDLENRGHVCRGECHNKIHTAAKEGKPLTVAELKHAQLEHRGELKNYYDKYLYRRFKPVMGLIDKLLAEEKAKPVPNIRKIKSLVRDRKQHNRTLREIKAGLQGTRYITRTGKVAMMIKSFLAKYDNNLDPKEPKQTRYLHNLPSMDTNIKYEDPFDPEMYGELEDDDEYVPEMHMQNTRLPRETKRYNKIMHRISPQGSKEILNKIVGEEEIPYAKSLVKSINMFVRKFETVNLPHEGTAKYKPQLDSRTRINNKLKPHEMSNRKQEVNPYKAPPMGFGAKTNDADHVVPNYVPQDKTHAFKYRGRTYDASRMTPEEISDILAEMEQQIK
jgi:hypothetical protein